MSLKRTLLLDRNYFPAAQLFLSLSLMFGTWVVYIPSITQKLNMSKGDLGIALFAAAVGSLISIYIGKKLVVRFGEGKLALGGVLGMTLFIFSFFLATSFLQLTVLMLFFGLTSGILQIGLNTVVSTLEKRDKISIMSSCHGYFSLGGLFAAGFGTVLLMLLKNPVLHISLAALTVVWLQILTYKKFIHLNSSLEPVRATERKPARLNPRLVALAVIAVAAMVSEGAIADWSSLYLRDVALAPETQWGLGYAAFSLTMTLGRFMGDHFSQRFGPWQILMNGFVISILGFGFVLVAQPMLTLIGFAFVGAGFSIIVPEAYRLSTQIEGVSPANGIAFMAGSAYLGFLGGPVALGAIAEKSGLHTSFVFIMALAVVGLATTFFVWLKLLVPIKLNLLRIFVRNKA
ncbi:MAG: MFS transporter [Mangrovibacterium sp.]